MDQTTVSQEWGTYNLWDFHELEQSKSIRVTSPENFLHYLFSEGTRHVTHNGYHVGKGFVDFKLYGPITDDARFDGKQLFESEVNKGFSSKAIERCCLYIEYRLYKTDVKELLLTPEDKYAFGEQLRGRGFTGVTLNEMYKTLGITGE